MAVAASNNELLIVVRVKDEASPQIEKIARSLKGPLSDGGAGGVGQTRLNREASSAQRQRIAELRSLVEAQRTAADGFARVGSEALGAFGPAGPAVRDVAAEIVALGGGLDVLISKLGISRGALLALGGGAAAVAAVGTALTGLTSQAIDSERALLRLASVSPDPRAAVAAAEEITSRVRSALGGALDREAILGSAQQELVEAGGDIGIASGRAFRASLIAAISQGDPASTSRALNDLFKGLRVAPDEELAKLDLLAAGAEQAREPVLALVASLSDIAPSAGRASISIDSLLAALIGAKAEGLNLAESNRGLAAILNIVSDRSNRVRQELEGQGVAFVDAAGNARPLLDILEDIRRVTGGNFGDLIPEEKTRRAFAAFVLGADKGRSVLLRLAAESEGALDRVFRRIGDLPSTTLGRTFADIDADLRKIGSAALDAVGGPVRIPTEIALPDNIQALREALTRAIEQGSGAGIVAFSARLREASEQADALFAEQEKKARAAFVANLRAERPAGLGGSLGIGEDLELARRLAEFTPPGPNRDQFRSAIFDIEEINALLARSKVLIDEVTGRSFRFTLTPEGGLERKFLDAVDALPPVERPVDLVLREDFRERIQRLLDQTDPAKLPVELARVPDEMANARAFLGSIPGTTTSETQLPDDFKSALAKVESGAPALLADLAAIAALDKEIANRALSGPERIIADAIARAEAVRKALENSPALKLLEGDEKGKEIVARITGGADAIEAKGRQDAEAAKTREAADAAGRLLALKIQLIDRERDLATAAGFTADADSLAARAASDRARLSRDSIEAGIASRRSQIDPENTDALKALDEERVLLLRIADAESAAAAAALDRARQDRATRTSDLVGDAQSGLLTGLDAELDAIQRNRAARVRAAEDGVRAGQLDADALARLLPLYDAIAARDEERARRAAQLRADEDIAGLARDAADGFGAQAAAIRALRDIERARYADSLRDEGLLQAEIEKRLALFDRITEKQERDAAIAFGLTPASQLAEQELLIAAYNRLRDAGVTAYEDIAAALAQAKTGQEALAAGIRSGLEDLRREFGDDFGFANNATRDLGLGFRDSLSSAFQGKRNEGESVGETFLRSNLENAQKVAADFAANKFSALLFGAPEGNKPGTPEELVFQGATVFDSAVTRFAGVVDGIAGVLPSIPTPIATDPIRTGNDTFFGTPAFDAPIGPELPPGFDQVGPTSDSLVAAGDKVADTITKGAQASANAIVSGGDAFGAGLTGVLGGIASQLGSLLTGSITGFLGFAEGGIVQGSMRAYTPHRAQFGRVVRQRTLIEVAENPGLEEAIIPLRGGAVPVRLDRREDPAFTRARERDARREREQNAELARSVRGSIDAPVRDRGRRDEARPLQVTIGGPTVNLSVTIEGGSGDRGQDLLAALPTIQRRLSVAIRDMTDRELVNAIRGVVS